MIRKLEPHKLIINFDDDGNFTDGIFCYHIRIDGVVNPKEMKSVSIKNAGHSVPHFNQFLKDVMNHARQAEGLKEEE